MGLGWGCSDILDLAARMVDATWRQFCGAQLADRNWDLLDRRIPRSANTLSDLPCMMVCAIGFGGIPVFTYIPHDRDVNDCMTKLGHLAATK